MMNSEVKDDEVCSRIAKSPWCSSDCNEDHYATMYDDGGYINRNDKICFVCKQVPSALYHDGHNCRDDKFSGCRGSFKLYVEYDDALFKAAQKGSVAEIENLLSQEGAEVNAKDQDGNSPIIIASQFGHFDAIDFLLSKGGACVNDKNTWQQGLCPILIATHKGHYKVVELLLSKGADVNIRDNMGFSPIIIASHYGFLDIVELFLSIEGVNVNDATDNNSSTPLLAASEKGHAEVVDFLISKGASVDVKNKEGKSPLLISISKGHFRIAEMLLSRGADVHVRDNYGFSPIILASRYGFIHIIELLISKGAKVEDKTDIIPDSFPGAVFSGGMSALHAACKKTVSTSVIKLLLSKGASIDTYDGKLHPQSCFSQLRGLIHPYSYSYISAEFREKVNKAIFILHKWPITMAILVLQELGLYFFIDCSSLIDLYLYLGEEEEEIEN